MTFWNRTYAMITFWLEQLAMRNQQCETLMASEEILKRLNHSDYDLVLADPSVPCGELLAAKELVKKDQIFSRQKLAYFKSKLFDFNFKGIQNQSRSISDRNGSNTDFKNEIDSGYP